MSETLIPTENEQLPGLSRRTRGFRGVLEAVFEIYWVLSKSLSQHAAQAKAQKVKHFIFASIHTAQLLSLSFPCRIDSWESFELWSTTTSMLRLDYFLDYWGLGDVYFYFLVGVLSSSLLVAVLAKIPPLRDATENAFSTKSDASFVKLRSRSGNKLVGCKLK